MTSNKESVRARFAPSPTGYPHLGSIWQALLVWLYARHNKGVFVLRIEDTDRTRFVADAEAKIVEALRWFDLTIDEGPDIGGEYGPYRQSARLKIYQQHADILINSGSAYYCFCSAERLQKLRKEQATRHEAPRYDGLCRDIAPTQAVRRSAAGEPYVIRMKMPRDGVTSFTDIIHGQISFRNEVIDDQIIMKSDGWPTYHLASVIDDHLMRIGPLVIRGEEWLPSTPKHLELYRAFGWSAPAYAHLPLILGVDRSKLSKRHFSSEALALRSEGYLPEAVVNFLVLLGWSSKTDQELFTLQELIERFGIAQVNKSGAIFDRQKLDWMNAQYIRHLSPTKLVELALPYLFSTKLIEERSENMFRLADGRMVESTYILNALDSVRDRLKRLNDVSQAVSVFCKIDNYEPGLLIWKGSDINLAHKALNRVSAFLGELSESNFTAEILEAKIKQLITDEGWKTGDVLWPVRVALSGLRESSGPFLIMSVLGKKESLRRIASACALLN